MLLLKQKDVQLLKELSVGFYRFSISWPRVIPSGELMEDGSGYNQAGIDYYNNLIDSLLENDIQPQVTLYHWDLPQVSVIETMKKTSYIKE